MLPSRTRGSYALLGLVACSSGFEPPCRVTDRRVVLDEPPATLAGIGLVGLSSRPLRPLLRSDGSSVFRWWRIQVDSDSIPSAATTTISAEVAVLDPQGVLETRHSFVPAHTIGQSFGIRDFAWMNDGVGLVYTRTTTTPVSTENMTSLMFAFEPTQTLGTLPDAQCLNCSFEWSTASFDDHFVTVYARRALTRSTDATDFPLRFATLSRTGDVLASGTLGPIETAPLGGAASFELVADRDVLLLKTKLLAQRITSTFEVQMGPIHYSSKGLPAVSWDSDRAALAWTSKILSSALATNADLFIQTYSFEGNPLSDENRLSTASTIEGMRPFLGGHAVAFTDGAGTYLALTSADGSKVGGDLPLDDSTDAPLTARPGLLETRSESTLELVQFTDRGLEAVEVACDR
ncbi:MAG: hypothetical protein HY791_17975 [Deltaproteobacteria bacterium]|nr:hypothetical protein [Deltaproteobacteria bacterium]